MLKSIKPSLKQGWRCQLHPGQAAEKQVRLKEQVPAQTVGAQQGSEMRTNSCLEEYEVKLGTLRDTQDQSVLHLPAFSLNLCGPAGSPDLKSHH